MSTDGYAKGGDDREIALEARERSDDARMFSPSAARNRDAIRSAFLAHMPRMGRILEVGSGTGEHAVHIAASTPDLHWTPSDPDRASRASIAAWIAKTALPNVAAPLDIDVSTPDWAGDARLEGPFDKTFAGLVSVNMIHIAPFAAAQGLIAGAGKLLAPGGRLFLYGPFRREGAHTSDSNAVFDENLRRRDPQWGVRDLEGEIVPLAESSGLKLHAAVAMPANNFSAIFERV